MTRFSRSTDRMADVLGRMFNRFAAVIVGLILMIVGLGMMATIVALPVGVILEVLGILILVWGFFNPAERSDEATNR
jgi:hypothetical protein